MNRLINPDLRCGFLWSCLFVFVIKSDGRHTLVREKCGTYHLESHTQHTTDWIGFKWMIQLNAVVNMLATTQNASDSSRYNYTMSVVKQSHIITYDDRRAKSAYGKQWNGKCLHERLCEKCAQKHKEKEWKEQRMQEGKKRRFDDDLVWWFGITANVETSPNEWECESGHQCRAWLRNEVLLEWICYRIVSIPKRI